MNYLSAVCEERSVWLPLLPVLLGFGHIYVTRTAVYTVFLVRLPTQSGLGDMGEELARTWISQTRNFGEKWGSSGYEIQVFLGILEKAFNNGVI